MNDFLKVSTLSIFLVLVGCTGENGTVQPLTPQAEIDAVATVNGKPIGKGVLELLAAEIKKQAKGANIPQEKLIQELINRELLLQEAIRNKLDQQPDVANRLEFAKGAVLFQAAVQEFLKNTPVTEAEAKDEYDRRISVVRTIQYKARHILLKSEEEANGIIKQLQNGGNFEKLAKQHSTGPTASKGGDLGWFDPKQMVPPFSQAVVEMQNGEFSKVPVKTQFGWHVILREDTQESDPPGFEEIKQRIIALMQQQKLLKHINNLKTDAEIVIKDPASVKAEAEPEPEAAEATTIGDSKAKLDSQPK